MARARAAEHGVGAGSRAQAAGSTEGMPERSNLNPSPDRFPEPDSDDLGYSDNEENRAYERSQPDSQPEVSSEPEPDGEPADAG